MRRPQPRRPVPLVRALSAWLLVLLVPVAVLPGFRRAAADPGPGVLVAIAGLAADEAGAAGDLASARQAWLGGRQASSQAAADQAAATQIARGSGATVGAQGQAWIVPAGTDVTVPPLALRAYRVAASWAAGFTPACRLSWSVLAGIGRIESNHGRHAGAAARFSPGGDVTPPILGPALDGRGGFAAIADSDGGRLDGDRVWDRAVGPMQFLPSTWRSLGRDGNGDRVADPGNLFDAAVSAAAYLCLGGGGDLSDPARLRQAVYGYNHSWSYVDNVLGWASFYAQRISGGPGVLPPLPPTTAAPSTSASTGTRPATTSAPTSTRPATTGPPSTTGPGSSTTGPAPTTTTRAPTTTVPCAAPTTTTTTTLPPGPTTTTSTTTTTLPPGSTTTMTTMTTLPPCPTSTTVATTRP